MRLQSSQQYLQLPLQTMIAKRKLEPNPALKKKPMRFKLGGLIKKKITWKKSMDALASSLHEVQLDLALNEDDSYDEGELSSPIDISPPPLGHPFAAEYTLVSHEQTLQHQSSSLELASHLRTPSDDPYNVCRTECISLLNSEMTSAMTYDESDRDSMADTNANFSSLPSLVVDDFVPFDASLEEPVSDYRLGGYHPVGIGDQYASDVSRYRVIHKLGWGHFSTVWLCVSLVKGDLVALKIVKLGPNYSDAARDEINILKTLQAHDEDVLVSRHSKRDGANIVSLLDNFQITGPNGTHLAMVFELMGESLLHLVYNLRANRVVLGSPACEFPPALLPMPKVKLIMKQILHSVHYMHQRGIVHTDLKPENILLTHRGDDISEMSLLVHMACSKSRILPSRPLNTNLSHLKDSDLTVKIADLGNATRTHQHFTNNIQTRQYRAPEILLGYKSWGALADVWSIGCLAFELLTGDYLFDPKESVSFSKDEDHLAQIIELTGHFPSPEYLSNCELSPVYFMDAQNMRNITSLKFWPLKSVLVEKYKFRADDDDVNLLCDFVSKCLRYTLDERYDCASLLAHPWFNDDAKYDSSECDLLPNHCRQIVGFTHEA